MKPGNYSIGSDVWPGLSKLTEEMGELQQVLGKLLGTGGEAKHWDGTDLRQRAEEEAADAQAALLFFVTHNGLNGAAFRERVKRKLALFNEWHHTPAPTPTPTQPWPPPFMHPNRVPDDEPFTGCGCCRNRPAGPGEPARPYHATGCPWDV